MKRLAFVMAVFVCAPLDAQEILKQAVPVVIAAEAKHPHTGVVLRNKYFAGIKMGANGPYAIIVCDVNANGSVVCGTFANDKAVEQGLILPK